MLHPEIIDFSRTTNTCVQGPLSIGRVHLSSRQQHISLHCRSFMGGRRCSHSAEAALAQQRAQLHIFERLLVARNELGAPPAATCAAAAQHGPM